MSQTLQTRAESDYTRAFSDASANQPDRSEIILHVPNVNATSLGTALPLIQRSSYPWLHKEAVFLLGLIRLIYLFIFWWTSSRC
jgi:hypothetical protein